MSETQKGNVAIIGMAILNGFFPVIAVLSYKTLSPLASFACSTFITGLFFLGVIWYKKSWGELGNHTIWKDIMFVVLIMCVFGFSLTYIGFQYTTPTNAMLIALTEVFFSYLLFNVWKREEITKKHIFGGLLILTSAFVILFPNFGNLNKGDLFILIAAMCFPFGNYFQKRLLQKISVQTILFLRTVISLPFIVLLVYLRDEVPTYQDIHTSIWFLLINGLLVLGLSKILWLEGIKRISVTKAQILLSLSPAVTMISSYLILKHIPTVLQIATFIPLLIGVRLLTSQNIKTK